MADSETQEHPFDLGAILARIGDIPTHREEGGLVTHKGPPLKGAIIPSTLDILKSAYPEMVRSSGSFIPENGLQPDDPNFGSFRALGAAFKYNVPPHARESENIEDRRYTHPSMPTSDFVNYSGPTINDRPITTSPPPSSAAGVRGLPGAQSGSAPMRNQWTTDTTTIPAAWDTQVVPFKHGGSITDATRQLLAKLLAKARA